MLQVLVQEFGLKVDIQFIMSLAALLEAFSAKMLAVSLHATNCRWKMPSTIKPSYNCVVYNA